MLQSPDRKAISHRARFIALLSATALVAPSFAQSLPTGGTVSAGNAVIGGEANGAITINQSSANAVINWQSFNIGAGSTVNFVQPGASSAILNRVTGATTTSIAGQLNANGQVYLINPNGIAITATGTVSTGAFVASTLAITDDAFMAGGRTFSGNGASAPVTNAGTITIERGGYLALIGGSVANSGTITVPMGHAALGSGEQATLDLSGDGFLQVAMPTNGQSSDALVSNSGTISANGGMVQLTAAAARDVARQAVNMSGTVEARGVSGRSGDITLFGGEGKVVVTGRVVVGNTEGKGGSVTVAGREIELATAVIDASGTTGGGTIHIGGERQGGGTLSHAEKLSVDAGTTINADATISGNGGDVVLWSDSLTRFAGTITARGGALSGNGGQVEVSGKARLSYTGLTDLTAANGGFGDLLLDPYNVTISNGTASNQSGFTATGDDSIINATALQTALATANVTVSTGSSGTQAGDITVASALTWNSGSLLTLAAAGSIAINAPIIVAGDGQVAFNFSTANTLTGGLAFAPGSALTFTDGAHQGTQALTINGSAFTLLRSLYDVETLTGQNFGEGYFALAHDLDASGRTYDDALIGNTFSDTFYGTLEGLGHIISNLTIVSRVSGPIGLIGRLGRYGAAGNGMDGVVRNIGLVGGSVTGGGIGFESPEGTGGLVGANNGGTIISAYNTGTVSGEFRVGGLVGVNTDGRIISSYATGAVSAVAGPNAHHSIGGLVGQNITQNLVLVTVTNSYATGTVNGDSYVGGLIGNSGLDGGGYGGSVTDVYATGAVHGVGNYVGGLVGSHNGSLTNAYATGAVSGADYVGGVAGWYRGNSASATDFLYATGAVSGRNFVGGLIGYNTSGLRGAYATGAVTGAGDNVGGLIGANRGFLGTVYATGAVSSTGNNVGGLVGDNGGRLTVGYATGEVRGADSVGGLVGFNYVQVIDAYATGAVTGANHVGGLVGLGYWAREGLDGTVTRAYATGAVSGNTNTGGLVGFATSGTTRNSYWDVETSGQSSDGAGSTAIGLTTAQMRNPFTFIDAGWNFAAVWGTPRAGGAPVLRGMTTAPLYDNYVRLSGNTSTTYGDTITTSGITLGGIGAGNVSVGWGSAISATTNAGVYGYDGSNILALAYSTGVAGDYYLDYGTGALTINRRALSVTSDSQSRIYGNANPALTYSVGGAGLVNGDVITGLLATTAGQFSNVGAYGVTQGSLAASSNYSLTYTGADLSVTQRALNVVADILSRTYGEANPSLTYTSTGLVNGDALSGSLATTAGQFSDVGVYGVTQGSLAASGNYAVTYTGANLAVGQRGITITADSLNRTYGDANPALTYVANGLVNSDALWGTLTSLAGLSSDVGTYGITLGTLANANYAISYTGADLTVTPATLTVATANAAMTYGDTPPTGIGYQVSGWKNGHTDTLLSGVSVSSGNTSNAGLFATSASGGLLGGAASGNYAISYVDGVMTIHRRAITVTADAATRAYGDANGPLVWTASGLVNNDSLAGTLATTADARSGVGVYGIGLGTLGNANYAISYTAADLTVIRRDITVTANDLARYYGADNPSLGWTVGDMGLVNGDTLSGDLFTAAGRSSEVGQYAITHGSLAASANYNFAFTPGTLTVEMLRSMPAGTSASNVGGTFGKTRFAAPPPGAGEIWDGADGSENAVVCLDDGGCVAVPSSTPN